MHWNRIPVIMVMRSKRRPSSYKGIPIYSPLGLHTRVLEILSEHVPVGSRVVEFGCGPGALTKRMQDHGYEVTPSDLNPKKQSSDSFAKQIDLNTSFSSEFN